jgi:hypothetical protein
VSSASETLSKIDIPGRQRISKGELFLLCCSLLSLLASCILWSSHKQAWMDEIFTWKEASDPSLWHLYYAIQHGADGGQPLFYTTAWLWVRVFGNGVLTLRLYSCIAMCGALLLTWKTIRRFYGMWATAFGVLFLFGTSGTLLDQNAEARFYGLYMLAVAVTVEIYARLVTRSEPTRVLLVLACVSQAALVLTHVLGLVYSGLILLALILFDAAKGRLRYRVYLVYAAGWLALLVWVPAIRASMAVGRPHGWIRMPTLTDLRTVYLFGDSLQWFRLFKRHSLEVLFQIVSHAVELVIYVPLAVVFVLGLRQLSKRGQRALSDPTGAFLLLAYMLLSVPVVLFVLSHLIAPVLVSRYVLPSGIGLAIVLAASADGLGSDSHAPSRLASRAMWAAIVLVLIVSPMLTVLALGPVDVNWAYLDVRRVEQHLPPNAAVVAGWQQDFVKFMRFSRNSNVHYYFLLDWPAALVGPSEFTVDYHLMQAYRNSGYYANSIQDGRDFLCSHTDFFVLDSPNSTTLDDYNRSLDMQKPNWFDLNVRMLPQFDWKVIASFDATEATRKLIAVHRKAPLNFCNRRDTAAKGGF